MFNFQTIERCVNKSPAKDVKNSEVMKLSRSFTEQENQVSSPHSDSVEVNINYLICLYLYYFCIKCLHSN